MKLEAEVQLTRGAFHLNARTTWQGGVLGVMGPSGCGKSTWLHALAGITRPDAGRIVLNGRVLFDHDRGICLPPQQRCIAVVFQDDRLWPHRSVKGNILYGYRRTPRARRRLEPDAVIEQLGLRPLLHRYVGHLSGGERRRVGLARALLTSPDLLLLDEPTNGLDPRMCDHVLGLIGNVIAASGTPAIMVSHRTDHLLRLTDNLMAMQDGRVIAQGAALRSMAAIVRLGYHGAANIVNRIEARVARHRAEVGLTELSLDTIEGDTPRIIRGIHQPNLPEGGRAVALLSSDQIVLAMAPVETVSMQNRLPGCVIETIATGEGLVCMVDVGVTLLARITQQAQSDFGIVPGARIWVLFKASALRVHPCCATRSSAVASPLHDVPETRTAGQPTSMTYAPAPCEPGAVSGECAGR